MQNKPPIPFQGNKKLWKNKFIDIIKEMGEYDIYILIYLEVLAFYRIGLNISSHLQPLYIMISINTKTDANK